MMLPEKKPKSKGFFNDLYEDLFKWSLIKSIGLYGFGIFGFLVIKSSIDTPLESL